MPLVLCLNAFNRPFWIASGLIWLIGYVEIHADSIGAEFAGECFVGKFESFYATFSVAVLIL